MVLQVNQLQPAIGQCTQHREPASQVESVHRVHCLTWELMLQLDNSEGCIVKRQGTA